jgi:hypothetical protein
MTAYVHKTAAQLHAEDVGPSPTGAADLTAGNSKVNELSKKKRASGQPGAFGQISRAHENAIFLQAMSTRFRGLISVMALMLLVGIGFAPVLLQFGLVLLLDSVREGHWGSAFLCIAVEVLLGLVFVATLTAAIRAYRIDLFGPKDIPIVFNRKTRKVYRFIQDLPVFPSSNNWREFKASLPRFPGYWMSVFKPWPPMLLIEYDWDCLEAEYFEQTRLVGKVVTTLHVLQLVAKESPSSEKSIGGFTLASPLLVGRTTAMDLWEHIRRFMEENGPALSPGDEPSPPYPTTLIQAAYTVTPAWFVAVAGCAWAWWYMAQHGWPAQIGGYTGLAVFAVALVCSMMTALFIFNWLAHKFGQDVTLPPELMADAGERIDLQALAENAKRGARGRRE